MTLFHIIAAMVIGYLLGSIPFAVIVSRRHGVDIFKVGSGNPGATNVKRSVGRAAGNLVFVLDFLKGLVAAGLPLLLLPGEIIPAILGLLAAVAGHSFSCFLRFRGGKGVATTMGGLLALAPWVFFAGIGTWLLIFLLTGYVALASICFALILPAVNLLLSGPVELSLFFLFIAVLVIYRHRANIKRLREGTEPRHLKH